jgi:hypothetical protein
MDVAPPHLVRESKLVVSRRVELIECLALAVIRHIVAGCEVVFGCDLRRRPPWQRRSHLPVSRPCIQRILLESTSLQCHLDTVIKPRRQLTGDAGSDGGLRERAQCAKLAAKIDVAPPEDVRLDGRLGQQLRRCRIRARQTIAVSALVEFIRQATNERCAEEIHLEERRTQCDFRGVPTAPGVHPWQ